MLALAMLKVVWAEQQQAQGHISSIPTIAEGNMQLDSISAGIPNYVCAAMCLNILKVDLGRNELPDPYVRASVCIYVCVCLCLCMHVYKYNIYVYT